MRLKPGGDWMPFSAEQWSSASEVAFRWSARVKMAPLVTAFVDDGYEGGQGRLDARIWGILPVVRARGLDIDRGEVARYLAELPWNPMAIACNPELHFAEGRDGPVRVWSGDPDTYVDLRFDGNGDIVGTFSRTRTRDGQPFPWEGEFSAYGELGGIRLPTRAEVSWHLPAGKFTYWRGSVTAFSWHD